MANISNFEAVHFPQFMQFQSAIIDSFSSPVKGLEAATVALPVIRNAVSADISTPRNKSRFLMMWADVTMNKAAAIILRQRNISSVIHRRSCCTAISQLRQHGTPSRPSIKSRHPSSRQRLFHRLCTDMRRTISTCSSAPSLGPRTRSD